MSLLANLFTCSNLICGFLSIIFSLEEHFTFSSWAIIFSVIFDGLDGQIARRSSTVDHFGKEFDSLVDVISFGIAPTILGYIFVYRHFHLSATIALFIYLFCSVLRLAKYNIAPKENLLSHFYGLPTTVSGGTLASFILIYRRYTAKLPPPFIFLLLTLLLSFLMVSKVRYVNLYGIEAVLQKNKLFILGSILVALIAVTVFYLITFVFLPELIIFTLFIMYLLFSPFMVKSLST